MIYGGHHSLMPQPRPLPRKTSALDGYYKNGIPITTAMIGDTITYDVPGHTPGQVWLLQTINGAQSYNGPFSVPMAPYALSVNDRTGLYQNTVYSKSPSQGGIVWETDQLQVNPGQYAQPSGTTPSGPQCPSGMVPYAGYTDANGNWNAPGCMYPKTPAASTPAAGSGSTSTTTTTTTATTGGGGPGGGSLPDIGGGSSGSPFAAPGPDNMLLIAAAVLALVMLT